MEAKANKIIEPDNRLKAGANYLGKIHHPALGIRIPEIFLPGIINSLQKHKCAASLMLSFGHETALEEIIQAPPGRYEITVGHTGTSIRKYLVSGSRSARAAGIPVEMEADHLIVIQSSAQAMKRIKGIKTPVLEGPAALERSLGYNVQALEEAISTGVARAFTTDTSDLFDHQAELLSGRRLENAFRKAYNEDERKRIKASYVGRFRFKGADGKPVRLEVSRERCMRIALKYRHSVEVNIILYEEIKDRMRHDFAFEISLDETEKVTQSVDLFIYLGEWSQKGYPCDYVAPNMGFRKREDFSGDMVMLKNRARALHAIAGHYNSMLSFHDGSGDTPYSGKGRGVYELLLEGTGRLLKYKISGIYFELLIELLAGHKKGTDARILYELIHKEVMDFLRKQVEDKGPVCSGKLIKQIETYDSAHQDFDPRADCFRQYSFLALNFRDLKGRRYFRDRLIRLYTDDLKFRKHVDQEMEAMTSRLIDGLGFANNY